MNLGASRGHRCDVEGVIQENCLQDFEGSGNKSCLGGRASDEIKESSLLSVVCKYPHNSKLPQIKWV